MKNLDIVGIVSAYTNKKLDVKLPVAVAWKRRLNIDKLFKAKTLIDEALKEVSDKYSDDEHSTADEQGRRVKPEFLQQFVAEQAEILSQETDVDIKKVSIDELGDVCLSDADMDTLAFMIEGGD